MWLRLCFNLSVNETQVGTHLTIAENKPSDAAQFVQYKGVSHFFVSAQPFKRISLSSLFHFPVFYLATIQIRNFSGFIIYKGCIARANAPLATERNGIHLFFLKSYCVEMCYRYYNFTACAHVRNICLQNLIDIRCLAVSGKRNPHARTLARSTTLVDRVTIKSCFQQQARYDKESGKKVISIDYTLR